MSARPVLNKQLMSLNGKFILIVDDDTAMLRALRKVLTGEGGVVTSAHWAGDALDYLTEKLEPYDLVITDLRMPILGGETILRAVKKALPQIPVIVVTAFGSPEVKADCLNKGASAFLEKPLDTGQLLEAVNQVLAHRGAKAQRADEAHTSASRRERDSLKSGGGT